MLIRTLSLFFVIHFFMVSQVYGQISISSIQGNVSNGSTITILGSGFGAGDSVPLLWDDFETGTANTILTAPKIGTWNPDSRPSPVYSTARAHSGTKSSYSAYNTGNQWSSFTVNLPPADKFYQSFWFLYNTTGTAGQLKLVQVHGNSDSGDFAPGVMTGSSSTNWWFSYISTESGANDVDTRVNYPKPFDPTVPQNVWHHFEMLLKRSSAGNVPDGQVTIKLDQTVVYHQANVVTRENSAFNWEETSFFHGVTNMNAPTNVYIDDTYLNNSWARVIIADSPAYATITHSEIQVPSQWSNTSITITFNAGSFTDLNSTYLYVIDANGNANPVGIPLCSTCPKAPTNLKVQ